MLDAGKIEEITTGKSKEKVFELLGQPDVVSVFTSGCSKHWYNVGNRFESWIEFDKDGKVELFALHYETSKEKE